MNRLVQLSVNTPSPSSELKVRIYYPVRLLTGPDLRLIRTYDDFLRFYGEDPLAQLLFNWNYELLCHRVSYINSRANLTKYKIDSRYEYYQDTERYSNFSYIPPTTKNQSHINSYLITINDVPNYNDFYLAIRTKVKDVRSNLVYSYSMGLFGNEYILSQGNGVYETGVDNIKNNFDLEPIYKSKFLPKFEISESGYKEINLTKESFYLVLKEFLLNCGLIVEDLGFNRLLISTASEEFSYSINSDIVSFLELEDYYDRYFASIYKGHRILSIFSKYKTSESNITVKIEKLETGAYSIHISKALSDWVDEEYFTVEPENIEQINLISNYIEIKSFRDPMNPDDWDPTGTYILKGSFGFNDENFYLTRLSILNEEVIDGYYSGSKFYKTKELEEELIPEFSKVYLDLFESNHYIWNGIEYIAIDYIDEDIPQCEVILPFTKNKDIISEFREIFPNSLVLIGPSDPVINGIRIYPDSVFWFDYDREIPSSLVVLNILLDSSYYNDMNEFRLPEKLPIVPESSYDLRILKSDYGSELKSIYVYNSSKSRYTDRAFLIRAIIYRICKDISGTTMNEIHTYIESSCSQLSRIFNIDMTYELENEVQVDRTYSANLNILVDNRLFTRFNIITDLTFV